MNNQIELKDLVVLVADKEMESAIKGLLGRHTSIGIRSVAYDVFVHQHRDPGCLNEADQFLRSFVNRYRFALVAFDREGSGRTDNRQVLETEMEDRLSLVSWQDRSAVIVFEPELEIWVWSRSPHVDEILGWTNQPAPLRTWLVQQNYISEGQYKPRRPKEAMEAAMKKVKKPRSASIYLQLAQKVSLQGHTEPAFAKFQATLQKWFPQESA
jgi:hypothetical protein